MYSNANFDGCNKKKGLDNIQPGFLTVILTTSINFEVAAEWVICI